MCIRDRYEALQSQSSLKIAEIAKILNKKTILPIIQQLLEKNVIILENEINENYKPKLIKYIRLHPQYDSNSGLSDLLEMLKSAAKQKEIILKYFQLVATQKKAISQKQLLEASKSTSTQIKALVDKQILEEYYLQLDRVDFSKNQTENNLQLSQAQQKATNEIKAQWEQKSVCLLHGVTSSGKTEIYIKLIEEQLLTNKQVLYLLPEIALTLSLIHI